MTGRHPRACPTCGLWQRNAEVAALCPDPVHTRNPVIGDRVRHRMQDWEGEITRDLGEGYLEVWERQTLAPYAMPHSVAPADLEVIEQ